ncbi:hypothetical protein Mp_8g10520 [Marchantia polymorpha subsp. ruderalis]|uniref:Uncharacterized protein n=1 Tax=Marchantia polymorpha TaxID=3197 RepID=A0A2R6XMS7_MARPO|nr:hypothetical protein MARPO_0008s0170 [Marchantia polymorpha]BBN19414.1 hypothetical protein Mp_8g10520 [Marchantia polymorpha subsp. ruderalis]|eukprot:PTQ47418.1 hypothetical protein MARPO_0008s0170 [Marchantia polymorpha]
MSAFYHGDVRLSYNVPEITTSLLKLLALASARERGTRFFNMEGSKLTWLPNTVSTLSISVVSPLTAMETNSPPIIAGSLFPCR